MLIGSILNSIIPLNSMNASFYSIQLGNATANAIAWVSISQKVGLNFIT